jgi:ABC-type amino acid transport substrate-binding protein
LLITLSCRNKLHVRPWKMLKQTCAIVVPLFLIYIGIKVIHPLPEIKNEAKSIFDLNISSALPIEVLTAPLPPQSVEGDVFDHILATKILRVAYHLDVAPFSFLNTTNDVVGYDIAFAYELAYDLGCRLELVPFDYQNLHQDLTTHTFDIAMSAVSINETRLKEIAFTVPYLNPRIVLIVPEKYRKKFAKIDKMRKTRGLKIAVLKGSAFESLAKDHFPNNPLILLNNYEEFTLDKEEPVALLWEEQEGIAWTLSHREYRVILPDISLGLDTLAYAVAPHNPRFLSYLNQWLTLKKAEGFTARQYDLWVKGKTEIAIPQEPRWSILNILRKIFIHRT